MKKTLIEGHYASAPKHSSNGESYHAILGYFYPEYVTSLLLYSVLSLLDSFFIADLQVTSAYTTLGITNTLFHFITKIAEGFSIGMVVLCGQYNGVGEFKQAGRTVTDAFWTTCIVGGIIAAILYFGAYVIYEVFYEMPADIVSLGVPFLRLRALGVFFNFVFFALIGFLRGIKNTKIPMYIFMLGACVFVIFDYVLIFGKCGFNRMEFQGSALASVIQYGVMLIAVLCYLLKDTQLRKYSINLFSAVQWSNVRKLVGLSWPVMLDKASLALCQMWLAKTIACVSKSSAHESATILASFVVTKDIERFAILPAIAFAQVITFLVSNDYRAYNWQGIKGNIKKVVMLSLLFVGVLLAVFSLWPRFFIGFFDKKGAFCDFAACVIPMISALVFFDVLQLILSAALRGAADVKTVMWVRMMVAVGYFIPASYFISIAPIHNVFLKFMLVYGSLYLGNALISIMYIRRFKTDEWKKQTTKGAK